MEHYTRFLKIWECIWKMNKEEIYDYGIATSNCDGYRVEFETEEQKINYKAVFRGDG